MNAAQIVNESDLYKGLPLENRRCTLFKVGEIIRVLRTDVSRIIDFLQLIQTPDPTSTIFLYLMAVINPNMKIILTLTLLLCFRSIHAQTDSAIYFSPEIQAEYPGGQGAWFRYLQKNLRYPDQAVRNNTQGTVTTQFIVDSAGLEHDITVISGPEELRAETIRIIEKIKVWIPGIVHGKKINSWKIQSIRFKLESDSRTYDLIGNYPVSPVIGYSDKSPDKVWNIIIDYLTQNGMSFKTDSSIGLIISKKSRLPASYENENGILYYPDSYLVLEAEITQSGFRPRRPNFNIMGDWYFLVENKNGKTSVKISLLKINAFGEPVYHNSGERQILFNPNGRTTGVFENSIFDIIK
jgi:hypothetical protein